MSSDDEDLRLPRYLGACILSYKSSTHPIDISRRYWPRCARSCPCNSFLFMICNLPSLPVQSIITTAPLVWCFQNISCCKCCGGMEDAQYIVLVMHLYLRICSASPNIEPGSQLTTDSEADSASWNGALPRLLQAGIAFTAYLSAENMPMVSVNQERQPLQPLRYRGTYLST